MSTFFYWAARLEAAMPLYSDDVRISKFNIRWHNGQENQWPHSVCRQALYQDYERWFKEVYAPQFDRLRIYSDYPELRPQPDQQLVFFATMSPWLYILGKENMERSYSVDVERSYEGEWYKTKSRRYFIRLAPWIDHARAFYVTTGHPIRVAALEALGRDRNEAQELLSISIYDQLEKLEERRVKLRAMVVR